MHIRRMSNFTPFHTTLIDDIQKKKVTKVNQYLLGTKLGVGSNSKVLLAVDEDTNKRYAAKVIKLANASFGNAASQLEREIRIMRMMNHPNILKLHEVLHRKANNTAYLIMEFAAFGTLQDIIDKNINIDEMIIGSIFKQIISGLKYLHSHGICHHDVKPSNILICENGMAKLSDFGIGHSFQSADEVFGSPAYQAPEFFDDDDDIEIDPIKEDIWSLGVTLYETAFGKLPFFGENAYEVSYQVRNSSLTIPDSASPDLQDLLMGMLAINPQKRLSMDDIEKHPFIRNADYTFKIDIKPKISTPISSSKSASCVACEVCGDNYTFSVPKHCDSWPGCYENDY